MNWIIFLCVMAFGITGMAMVVPLIGLWPTIGLWLMMNAAVLPTQYITQEGGVTS